MYDLSDDKPVPNQLLILDHTCIACVCVYLTGMVQEWLNVKVRNGVFIEDDQSLILHEDQKIEA